MSLDSRCMGFVTNGGNVPFEGSMYFRHWLQAVYGLENGWGRVEKVGRGEHGRKGRVLQLP